MAWGELKEKTGQKTKKKAREDRGGISPIEHLGGKGNSTETSLRRGGTSMEKDKTTEKKWA